MNDLIKIAKQTIGVDEINAVDARELHTFLESKQDFSNWIRARIKKYNFLESLDFTSYTKFIERETGGSTRIEYTISMDMAKELSMVEANEKGHEARKYFIQCEREATALVKINTPTTTEQLKEDITMLEMIGGLTPTAREAYELRKVLYTKYGLITDSFPDFEEPVEPKTKSIITEGRASAMLKEINAEIGVRIFNRLMTKKGYLWDTNIITNSNVFVKRKELTSTGLEYGFMKSGSPRYFKDKFKQLYSKLI